MSIKLKPVFKSIEQSILVKNDRMNEFYAPHHYHPDYEIIYIKKSFGIRIIGNHIDNYRAGEVIMLGPGLPHYHIAGSHNGNDEFFIETIAVLFPESIIEANIQFPEFGKLLIVLEQIKYGIVLENDTKKAVQDILEQMSVTPSVSNFIALFRIIEVITNENSSYRSLSMVKYDNKVLYNHKTKYVLDFIANNYHHAISVEKVAQIAELSKTGFCNFFKTQTGYTFSQYVNRLRISKACEYLAISKKNISEIAFEVGFENLAYFNRKFKEIKLTTPVNFRKKLLRKVK